MSTADPASSRPSLRVAELAITNFRTFRDRTVIPFGAAAAEPDAIAVFHGDNGAGKSNALAALDLFFQTLRGFTYRAPVPGIEGTLEPWDTDLMHSGGRHPVVLAYRDRPHGSDGPMEIEVAFADPRVGRLRTTYTPSGDRVRVGLMRAVQGESFSPVKTDDVDSLRTWLLTPRGPRSVPLTILDARRRAQWTVGQGSRGLMPPDLAETLFSLRTSRLPEAREKWRGFVAILQRFSAFRGKEVSMERPPPPEGLGSLVPGPEIVVEEPGRVVLGADELSSGEQQVIVLSAASLLADSAILAIQEPEISLDVKSQRLFLDIIREVVDRGLVDQVILESHVPTFDDSEVIRFARSPDGATEVRRAPAVDEERRAVALRAKEQGAEQRWITRDGYTQLPDNMREDLRLAEGGHVWFVKGSKHWEAWPETELDELFGTSDESAGDDA